MTSFVILVSSTLYESVIPILEIITDQAMYVKAFLKRLKGVLGRQNIVDVDSFFSLSFIFTNQI